MTVAALRDIEGYAAELSLTEGLEPGEQLRGVELEGCTITGAALYRAGLIGCTFLDCVFTQVDLSLCALTDSRFSGCRFESSKMLGLDWAATSPIAVLDPPAFVDCRMDDATFGGSDLTGVTFQRCRLTGSDFAETTLRRARLEHCDLSGARFARTDLREASLVGSTGWLIDPRENRVSGLRVDASGVEGLVLPLGVTVEVGIGESGPLGM